jgi:glycosyltransferase involved in cell wall biosynthesis
MDQATITAVVPTYNRRDYVVRAIQSILDQASPPDEIVVVDDGSSDGTADLLEARFGKALRVVRQENGGVSEARKRGVEEARGEWIAFLDSDDEWTDGRMAILRRAMGAVPQDVAWIFGDTRLVYDHGDGETLFGKYHFQVAGDLEVFADPLSTQYPFQFTLLQSSLIRRQAIREAGALSHKLKSSEDLLLGFQVALAHRVAAVPDVVSRLYRTSALAASSLDNAGQRSPDYYLARVIAFDAAARARRQGPWRELHEAAARGWCLASGGKAGLAGALKQFRHRVTPKGIAFAAFASLGPAGLDAWRRLSRRVGGEVDTRYRVGHDDARPLQPSD